MPKMRLLLAVSFPGKKQLRRLLSSAIALGVLLNLSGGTVAFAAPSIFYNGDDALPITSNQLILDSDDSGGDVTLQFGDTAGKLLRYDSANIRFEFNDTLRITGDLTTSGDLGIGTASPATILEIDDDATPNLYIGNEVCSSASTLIGISIDTTAPPGNECANYTLLGDGTNVFLNAGNTGSISFRDGNTDVNLSINGLNGIVQVAHGMEIVGTLDAQNADILGQNALAFEGATGNEFETTFAITDPTADRTVTFKDESGTVALTSDLPADQNVFQTVNAPNGTDPVADGTTDTLNLADGAGITITGDSSTDTLTIASTLGTSIANSEIDDDTIDFDKITDNMTLDATTSVAMGSNDLNFDSNTLVIDSSENRVGIGTATPGSPLEISGAAVTSGSAVSISNLDSLTGGSGIAITSNTASVGNHALVSLVNNNATDVAGRGLYVRQDGQGNAIRVDSTNTNGTNIYLDSEATVGTGVFLDVDTLTTGYGMRISSDTTSSSTHSLLTLDSSSAAATGQIGLEIIQNAGGTGLLLDRNGTGGTGLLIDATPVTTGTGIDIDNLDALTTGTALDINSNSADTSTRNLVQIINDNTAATGATGLYVQQDSTAPAAVLMGDVGIGSTTPSRKLDVQATDATYLTVSDNTGERVLVGYTEGELADATVFDNIEPVQILSDTQGNLNIATRSNLTTSDINFFTDNGTLAQRMIIDQDGDVGIGTTSPTHALEVEGSVKTRDGVLFEDGSTQSYGATPSGIDWNVQTAVYKQNTSVSTEDSGPQGLFFRADGLKMYVTGISGTPTNGTVYEYNLSTAWDITTKSYVQEFGIPTSTSPFEYEPNGIFFRPDGLRMYIVGNTHDEIYQYNLSSAWDISTASRVDNFDIGTQAGAPEALFFKPDGKVAYTVSSSPRTVHAFDLSTPWDLTTAAYNSVLFSVSSQATTPTGLHFKSDGTRMFVVDEFNNDVFGYDLATPWDITTAVHTQTIDTSGQETLPVDIFFKPDATKMYILGRTGVDVNEYDLGLTTLGNVGIGTNNPDAPLEVQTSNTAAEAPIAQFTTHNDRPLQILQPDTSSNADPFTFATNNAFTFRVDAIDALNITDVGSVGVNVTNPQANFAVPEESTILFQRSDNSQEAAIINTNDHLYFESWRGNGNIGFSTTGEISTSGTDLVIDEGGRVGIGIDNPTQLLNINGANTTSTTQIRFSQTGGSDAFIGLNGSATNHFDMWNYTNSPIRMATNGTLRMYIDSDGEIGIGNETTPDEELHVRAANATLRLDDDGTDYANLSVETDGDFRITLNSPTQGGGHVAEYDGDSNWDFPSDERLKTGIEDSENILDKVLQLQVRRYNYKNDEVSDEKEIGFIAQEVEQLFPELVGSTQNDEFGEVKTLGYTTFGVIALKAIQEQQAQIEADRVELETQKAHIANLRQAVMTNLINDELEAKLEAKDAQAAHLAEIEQTLPQTETESSTLEKLLNMVRSLSDTVEDLKTKVSDEEENPAEEMSSARGAQPLGLTLDAPVSLALPGSVSYQP